MGIEYPTTINENNYTLLEKHNPKIALIVLHVDVDIKIFQNLGQVCAYVYKWIKQSPLSINILKEKKFNNSR